MDCFLPSPGPVNLCLIIKSGLILSLRQVYHGELVPDSFSDIVGRVSWQRVVEVTDEIVPVLLRQSHECASHHNELHFIHAVTQLLELDVQTQQHNDINTI